MTRLPKKRGITQDGEDKSLILRQNVRQPVIRRVAPSHTDIEDVLFPHWPF